MILSAKSLAAELPKETNDAVQDTWSLIDPDTIFACVCALQITRWLQGVAHQRLAHFKMQTACSTSAAPDCCRVQSSRR